jgi:positive regulator of sigma E activity
MHPSQPGSAPRPTRAQPSLDDSQEATAAAIYGVIVSAAVMAVAHAPSAAATVVAVLVTLTIYWAAERYARIVAERIHEGHRPRWHTVREQLTCGWQMITASFLPLAVLLLVRLLGADLRTATIWALVCSTVLLCGAGWRIGRHGGLSTLERAVSSAVAGVFGIGLIVLKTLLH